MHLELHVEDRKPDWLSLSIFMSDSADVLLHVFGLNSRTGLFLHICCWCLWKQQAGDYLKPVCLLAGDDLISSEDQITCYCWNERHSWFCLSVVVDLEGHKMQCKWFKINILTDRPTCFWFESENRMFNDKRKFKKSTRTFEQTFYFDRIQNRTLIVKISPQGS